jgi:hypothetical protein
MSRGKPVCRPLQSPGCARFQSRPERFVVGLAVVVLAPLLDGCASSCVEAERADYPQLERVAAEMMSGIDADMSRIGSCETTGQPSAVVNAHLDMSVWSTNKQARKYFMERGWTPDAGRLLSPDGRYLVSYGSVTYDDGPRFEVFFYMTPSDMVGD